MVTSEQQLQADLLLAGIIRAIGLMSLLAMVAVCHIYAQQIQLGFDEQDRIWIRSVLYVVAITTFPVMKFVRHVLLRLNQTMSGDLSPKFRYLITIVVSMLVAESIGLYGFIMYILGDSFNTLYIFIVLSALAMFLYRPQIDEYRLVVESQNI
ncbi:MAG: hypothetical protein methR_P2873 [Methyloprofundus sp.]|nr:MAG: hypothetical protein methR_P2873 [Methyloprofundus sp.]